MAGPSSRVSRVLMMGPLAAFADAYATEVKERGYTPLTTVNELRQVGRLSRWLDAGGLGATELDTLVKIAAVTGAEFAIDIAPQGAVPRLVGKAVRDTPAHVYGGASVLVAAR